MLKWNFGEAVMRPLVVASSPKIHFEITAASRLPGTYSLKRFSGTQLWDHPMKSCAVKCLQQQIAATVSGVEQISRRALAGARDPTLDGERRRLVSSVNN